MVLTTDCYWPYSIPRLLPSLLCKNCSTRCSLVKSINDWDIIPKLICCVICCYYSIALACAPAACKHIGNTVVCVYYLVVNWETPTFTQWRRRRRMGRQMIEWHYCWAAIVCVVSIPLWRLWQTYPLWKGRTQQWLFPDYLPTYQPDWRDMVALTEENIIELLGDFACNSHPHLVVNDCCSQ